MASHAAGTEGAWARSRAGIRLGLPHQGFLLWRWMVPGSRGAAAGSALGMPLDHTSFLSFSLSQAEVGTPEVHG